MHSRKQNLILQPSALSVWRIRSCHSCQFRLPLVSVREELLLIIQKLLARLCRVLGVRALHDGIHGARLLTEAAVNALGHINVVARRSSAAIFSLFSFDCDGLCRADGLAQLAGDAALLARGVSSQSMFATEARGDGALLERVVYGVSIDTILVLPYSCLHCRSNGRRRTYGGRKNCSRSTYIPLAISVRRKYLPAASQMLSLFSFHFRGVGSLKP